MSARATTLAGILCLLVSGGAAIGATAASGRPEPRTVPVTIHYSRFDPGTFDVASGETVRFVVTNSDPIDHEFIIGDEALQRAHEVGTQAYHAPEPGVMSVPAGATMETTYTFPSTPGALILGCHLPGHYAFGMRAPITIG